MPYRSENFFRYRVGLWGCIGSGLVSFVNTLGAETFLRVFYTKLAEQSQGVIANVHGVGVSVFWSI